MVYALEVEPMKAAIIVAIVIGVLAFVGLAAVWLLVTGWFADRKRCADARRSAELRTRLGYRPPDPWERVLQAQSAGTGLHLSAAEIERLVGVDAIRRAALEAARAADRENVKKLETALDAVLAAKRGGES